MASPLLVVALPLAFLVNGLGLAAAMICLKWAIVGRAPSGMHVRLSIFGLRFWLAQVHPAVLCPAARRTVLSFAHCCIRRLSACLSYLHLLHRK